MSPVETISGAAGLLSRGTCSCGASGAGDAGVLQARTAAASHLANGAAPFGAGRLLAQCQLMVMEIMPKDVQDKTTTIDVEKKETTDPDSATKTEERCLPCDAVTGGQREAHSDPVVLIDDDVSHSSDSDESSALPIDQMADKLKLVLGIDQDKEAAEPPSAEDEITRWRDATQFRQPPNGVLTYQLCRHYKGPSTCQYGESCSFAHGEKELGVWIGLQAKSADETLSPVETGAVVRSQRPGTFVLCKFFLTGNCGKGDECSFAHSIKELKAWNSAATPPPDESPRAAAATPPTKSGEALVLDSNTPLRPPPKNVMCAFQLCKYLRSGLCPRGMECPFAHGTTELRIWSKARRKDRQMKAKSIMSSPPGEYTDDDAKRSGAAAKVRPPPVGLTMMPQLCSYFTESHCDKGYFCTFAHSVEELRAWEKARQSGHITRPYPRQTVGSFLLCEHGLDACPLGTMCPNAHSEAELESWNAQRDAELSRARPHASPRHHNGDEMGAAAAGGGGGEGGGDYRIPHVQSRGTPRPRPLGFDRPFQLCSHFKAGRCTKVDCTFAHGETERAAWEAERGAANMLEEEASGAAPSGAGAEAAAAPAADAAAAAANGAGVGGLFAQLAQVQQAAQAAAAQAAAGTAAAE